LSITKTSRGAPTPSNRSRSGRDLLFEIDARPFHAKYDQAMAGIDVRESERKFREPDLTRVSGLLEKKAVSQSAFDEAQAKHAQSVASLAAARAAAAEAKLSPGLFVRTRVPLTNPYRALLVPERVVGTDQGQEFLLVVNAGNQVEYGRVTVGIVEFAKQPVKDEQVLAQISRTTRLGDVTVTTRPATTQYV
jgi:phage head maturation protease